MRALAPAAVPARASAPTARPAVSAARAEVTAARVSVSAARAAATDARAVVSDARAWVTAARASIADARAAISDARAAITAARAAVSAAAPLVVALALALGPAGCGGPPPRALAPLPAASAAPLPPLEYRLRTGEPWTSRAALGRVLVLYAWATYCKPCREAFPKLGRLAAAYPDAVMIGVSLDEDDDVVEAFLREVPAGFPIARDEERILQFGPLAMTQVPTLLVIDRLGRVRFRGEPMKEPDYDGLPGLVAAVLAE